MTEKAAAPTTTSDKTGKNPKRLFFINLLDLSWKLALSIIVPVLLGSYIDKKLAKNSLFTIIGLFIGFGLSAWIIRNIVFKLQKETSE